MTPLDPLNPSFSDSTVNGVSNPSQVPFTNVNFSAINQMGRQWIRQYTLALCMELLGIIRTKMKRIPIPGADLELNGPELMQQGREDKTKLRDQLRDLLSSLTYDKLLEIEASKAENLNTQLRYLPMIRPIFIG
jgi:hypothetical protein